MPNETFGDSPPSATITTTHGDVPPRPLPVPPEIVEWVIDRQTRGAGLPVLSSGILTAATQLRDLMTAELARVVFTLPEAKLMVDAVYDTVFSPYLVGPEMAKRIEGGAEDVQEYSAADCGFENNKQLLAFIERLKFYGPTCDFAIRDAISRWYKQDPAQRAKTIEGFASVGLRVVHDELARVVLEEGL